MILKNQKKKTENLELPWQVIYGLHSYPINIHYVFTISFNRFH